MAFSRPTLSDLINRAFADIQSRLPGADVSLRRSNLNVLSRVHAGVVHGLYGFIDWLSKQLIYDTAEAEYLERWASIWGVNRIPASFATGTATVTGTDGVVIPAGTELQRVDGELYTVDADVTIASGTAVVSITAFEAGQVGNIDSVSTLSLTTPIAGIATDVTTITVGSGADAESDEALRVRLISRIQQPPHGGAKYDYEAWAKQVAGVTRVWVSPIEQGLGSVTVRFVRDDDVSIIPDAGEVATVRDYIDSVRPVTALVYVGAPIAAPINFNIAVVPNTAAVKAAVEAELIDLIRREGQPGGTIYLSHIRAAISVATGESNYTMTLPAADVANGAGVISTMGTITWS